MSTWLLSRKHLYCCMRTVKLQLYYLSLVQACLFIIMMKSSEQSTSFERNNNYRPAIGEPFKLFDTENNTVTESTFCGNWILMYFGYTSSPDAGPREVKKMADVTKILDNVYYFKIMPVFITIDPQRDTPTRLEAYLKEFDPRIIDRANRSCICCKADCTRLPYVVQGRRRRPRLSC